MRDTLNCVVGKENLIFVDEKLKSIQGIIMEIESPLTSEEVFDRFFVSYEPNIKPFKISCTGPQRVHVSKDKNEVYGHSNNYERTASQEELEALSLAEGLLNWANPQGEIQERRNASLISRYVTPRETPKINFGSLRFPSGDFF